MNTPSKPRFSPALTGADYPKELIEGIVSVLHPPILITVNMHEFVRHLFASMSLSIIEKYHIASSTATLSQFQVNEMSKIFIQKNNDFYKLAYEQWHEVAKLGSKAWLEANMLANYFGVGYDTMQAERCALHTMLNTKYSTPQKHKWVERALQESNSLLVKQVYGAFMPINDTRPSNRDGDSMINIPDLF